MEGLVVWHNIYSPPGTMSRKMPSELLVSISRSFLLMSCLLLSDRSGYFAPVATHVLLAEAKTHFAHVRFRLCTESSLCHRQFGICSPLHCSGTLIKITNLAENLYTLHTLQRTTTKMWCGCPKLDWNSENCVYICAQRLIDWNPIAVDHSNNIQPGSS